MELILLEDLIVNIGKVQLLIYECLDLFLISPRVKPLCPIL